MLATVMMRKVVTMHLCVLTLRQHAFNLCFVAAWGVSFSPTNLKRRMEEVNEENTPVVCSGIDVADGRGTNKRQQDGRRNRAGDRRTRAGEGRRLKGE